jgi:hypothetical protein
MDFRFNYSKKHFLKDHFRLQIIVPRNKRTIELKSHALNI